MHRNAFAVAVCALYLNIFALYLCHTLSVCQLLDSKHTFHIKYVPAKILHNGIAGLLTTNQLLDKYHGI